MSKKVKPNLKSPKIVEKWFNPLRNSPPPSNAPDIHFWTLAVHRLVLLVAFITLLFVVGAFLYAKWTYEHDKEIDRAALNKNTEINQKNFAKSAFEIIVPTNGDSVSCNDTIQGFSPYPKKKHYVLITTKFNEEWVQRNNQMIVSPGGKWVCPVRFGNGPLGRGELFIVRCIATDADLKFEPLSSLPKDAIISNAVKVYRKFDNCPPLPPLPSK